MNDISVPMTDLRAARSRRRQLLAWSVHLYTSLGLVAAAGIAVLIVQNAEDSYRWAFILMMVATLIDATDGTLARRFRVKEVLPGFDGRRLDDIVDFLTYTTLPLLLIWRARLLPEGQDWALLLPLLASAYGFSQVSAKTDDGYFLGFPSYWNLVALYLFILRPGEWLSMGLMLLLALLTFVPSRYLYPTQRGRLNMVTNALGAVWACLLVAILCHPLPNPVVDERVRVLTWVSLAFPVYYMAASWIITLKYWGKKTKKRTAMVNA